MIHATMAAAIEGARTLAQMDELSRQVWQAHATGALSDTAAQGFAERLHACRGTLRPPIAQLAASVGPVSLFRPRRPQVSPDRRASMLRRRLLAASGGMPPNLANGFTTAEQAALRIVGDEVRDHGACDRSLAEIAARAGCGRTSVQNAIRTARLMGLIAVEARPVKGAKSLPNVVTILSREWTAWLSRGTRRADPPGFKTVNPTDKKTKGKGFRKSEFESVESNMPVAGMAGVARNTISGMYALSLQRRQDGRHPDEFVPSRNGNRSR